jgi:hypothetical protein
MGNPNLKHSVEALQLSAEGLFKLLGSSDPNQRELFWEKLKGITSVAEFELVEQELVTINAIVKQAEASTKGIIAATKSIGEASKATGAG